MEYCTTIGADVSDRTTKICVMTKAEGCVMTKAEGGERRIVVETTCATTKAGFEEAFAKFDRSWPVVFETGMHCRWMDRLFKKMGFKAIVGNPGKIPSITKSNTKNDRNDARELARLALADPAMLHPVFLRDEVYQQMLRFHHARNMLISQRTQTINQIRRRRSTRSGGSPSRWGIASNVLRPRGSTSRARRTGRGSWRSAHGL